MKNSPVFIKCTKVLSMVIAVVFIVGLQGCANWSTSSVDQPEGAVVSGANTPTHPDMVIITEGDIKGRSYNIIGDITATVNKPTMFSADPTPNMVAAKLREEAAKIGADAVIQVRLGKVGVTLWSYGSLEGKGRAIKFTQ